MAWVVGCLLSGEDKRNWFGDPQVFGKNFTLQKQWNPWPVRVVMIAVTLTFISFTTYFSRSNDMATVQMIFERMRFHFRLESAPSNHKRLRDCVLRWWPLVTSSTGFRSRPNKIPPLVCYWYAACGADYDSCAVLVFAMYQLMSGEMQPFIYFQFWVNVTGNGPQVKFVVSVIPKAPNHVVISWRRRWLIQYYLKVGSNSSRLSWAIAKPCSKPISIIFSRSLCVP